MTEPEKHMIGFEHCDNSSDHLQAHIRSKPWKVQPQSYLRLQKLSNKAVQGDYEYRGGERGWRCTPGQAGLQSGQIA